MTEHSTSAAARPTGCTHLKLRQLNRLVTRHYEAAMAGSGLKITQYSLLAFVDKLGPLRAGNLAAVMQLDASTLSRNLQPLIERGLVQAAVGGDGRSRIVQATDAGRALRVQAQRAWKQAQVALNQQLGSQRVAALHGLIDDCIGELAQTENEHV
jgi:DNA-binding MarR family transcriptional regulator